MGGEVALALGDGVRAETDGATSAVELAGALAAVEEVETAGPGAGSPLQPKHISAARMQAERNVAAKRLLLLACMASHLFAHSPLKPNASSPRPGGTRFLPRTVNLSV
jgi:hypothetical protein